MPEPSPINDLLSDLVQPDEVDRFSDPVEARKKAMDYLARREHSRDELMRKLEKAGFDGNVALDAIEALKAEGLQSDRRFVEAFVQSNVRKGKGPARIRAHLRERGIREPLVDAVLTELDTDWAALAIAVHRRKFGDEVPVDFKEKARQMRFLQYRGFESEQIQAAVSGTD